ncbi:MAG: hypothetical protein A2Y10_18200 [Planctomycetes bacterium GWF2_41_51]|nr:MAG: hypothetical protein A2Y10_18200 [Planctomycetes bacterium GWF2_41_51]HBG27517.1 PEP-CTERM sorting domain-containing protein [Phycisphaerales bacterium]
MKRSLSLLIVFMFYTISNASVVTFDDNPLSVESNWGGAGSNETGFVSGGINFVHNANTWSWDGFAYSNKTDTTTQGEGNQFSACTGGGAGGSSNYAVSALALDWSGSYETLPTYITFSNVVEVTGGYFTNTTYAYLAMLNGYGAAREFDVEDWFKLTITGLDETDTATGTVDFFLADNGNIVNTWEYVDLSSLGEVKSLVFSLSSSDNHPVYGMNTPAYFAMDNLIIPEPTTMILLGLGSLLFRRKRR